MAIAFVVVGFLVTLVGGPSLIDHLSTPAPVQQVRPSTERDAAPAPDDVISVTKSGASAS